MSSSDPWLFYLIQVIDGAYAYVRHPMYAGLLLAGIGFSVIDPTAVRLIGSLALLFVLDAKVRDRSKSSCPARLPVRDVHCDLIYTCMLLLLQVRIEEEALMKKFPEYAEYRGRVNKLCPYIY